MKYVFFKIMTLTKENMETDPKGEIDDTIALLADINRMDDSQLEKYLRLAFTGVADKDFLPPSFWRGFSLNGGGYGSLETGQFFGGNVYHALFNGTLMTKPRIKIDAETPLRFTRILESSLSTGVA